MSETLPLVIFRAEKHFKLFTSPQRGEDARTCDLSVSFEARGIPKRFETEAMGHPRCCKVHPQPLCLHLHFAHHSN